MKPTVKPLTIGRVAERAGVGIETVRFYERKGLLDEPTRSAAGYRQFDEDVIRRLEFISRAKELGFTLKEVKELLALRVGPNICCEDVKAKADAKAADITAKIATLGRMRDILVQLSSACGDRASARGDGESTVDCPILETLEGRRPTQSG